VWTPRVPRRARAAGVARYPFEEIPRRIEGLDGAEELLRTMAGELGEPPVHGVLATNR